MPEVSCLRVAPVKGLSTVRRECVRIDERGVAEDRRAFLVHDDDSVATLRQHPELALVVPDLDLDAGKLAVAFPDGTVVADSLSVLGNPLHTRIFGKDRSGRVLRGELAGALSRFAGASLRVVLAESTGVGWDEGPVSLIGTASSDAFAPDRGDARRFRMTVELAGTEPHEEDSWIGSRLAVGRAVLRVRKPVKRCVIVNRSPDTGAGDADILRELVRRRGQDTMCLGVLAEVLRPGEMAVGDELRVEAG